ncbi:SDR family NAD(P)-dependent oxidoreductase [Pontitalea aquivivens]|uniref:SDR family NAD(P)-dependent oxidoreductase n=1 Tax=Pontitalea aquivivens TaxID=3388663 RepID=UPI003970A058
MMTRTAIVTGGARGIGAAIALRLAQDGCNVAVLDLNGEATQTMDAIRVTGRQAMAVAVNVADPDAVEAAVAQVADRLGPPTVLVNNAGLLREGTLARFPVADWDAVQDVNLRAVFLMTRAVQPHMRVANWGRVVNLTSIGALGGFGLSAYSAAKAGLHGLTKSLAIEMGRFGVTVNAVAPGLTETTMIDEMSQRAGVSVEQLRDEALRDIPIGRLGLPEDIAQAVSFFADDRSGFVSGQVLYVCGGPRA